MTKDIGSQVCEPEKKHYLCHQTISEDLAKRICEEVNNYSSYVQQLAWNVMAEANEIVTEQDIVNGYDALLAQNSSFFGEQTRGLSSYQLNFIRAICKGYHSGFASKDITEQFSLGTKSNITRIKTALLDREIIDVEGEQVFLADCVFQRWFIKQFGL